MIVRNAKTTLFVSLVAVLVMSFMAINYVDAEREYTKQDLKNSLKEWMISHDDQSLEKKTEELKNKFDQLLRDSIEQERINTHTQILNEKEIVSAMNYIIVETYKDEKLKRSSSDNINTMSADSDNFGIQYADAVCPATTNPTYSDVRKSLQSVF